ncbi:hypothetical protein UGMREWDR_CDS0188 [Aeromonas phage GomatiRiver_11]|nr:hypothetical protein OBDJBBDK_00177 [Aeromonas phage AhFM11]WKW84355.1 hypothetical protein UGMREWDR_CDS0188 [Aeromonas phage GomatiRiver_11]
MSHIIRMQDEHFELGDKIEKLQTFIDHSTIFVNLDFEQQDLMVMQLDAMKAYHQILGQRIDTASE